MDISLVERQAQRICGRHGSFTGTEREFNGRVFKAICPTCAEENVREKEAWEKRQALQAKADAISKMLGRSGIPERFKGRDFDNYNAASDGQKSALKTACAYAQNFDEMLKHGTGLVFCGKPGTGKTHLATAIANHIIHNGRSAVFVSAIRVARTVKETYRKNSETTEQQAIDFWVRPDLLILDEIGIQLGTETEKIILFEILNGRYEQVRPTIVISNLLEAELNNYLGARVVDRLREGGGAVLAFDWESYRAKVHKDKNLPVGDIQPVDWKRLSSRPSL
jgi:DNA replication protein DnaC